MPAQVERMSPESEQLLLRTSEKIADYTANGMCPNEAIAKAAADNGVPAGHVQLLVNAYNTSRTNTQREGGRDVWDKSAEFAIADAPSILELMYPAKPKTAAEIVNETTISSDYKDSPRTLTRMLTKKSCDMPAPKAAPKHVAPPAFEPRLKKEKGKLEKMKKASDEARMKWQSAEALVAQSIDALVQSFHNPEARAYTDVKEGCSRLFGKEAFALFNYIEKRRPDLVKFGKSNRNLPARGPSYELAEQCLAAKTYAEKLGADYQAKAAAYDEAYKDYRKFLGAKEPETPRNLLFGWVVDNTPKVAAAVPAPIFAWDRKEAAEGKSPFSFTGSVLGALGSSTGGGLAKNIQDFNKKIQEKQMDQAVSNIAAPPKPDKGIEDEMRQIRQRNVLQDLLSTDEVVSGHDPHEVLRAYKEIADVAPLAVQRGAIAKDFMRRRLSTGQLSYFDLQALAQLEKNMAELQGQLPTKADTFKSTDR